MNLSKRQVRKASQAEQTQNASQMALNALKQLQNLNNLVGTFISTVEILVEKGMVTHEEINNKLQDIAKRNKENPVRSDVQSEERPRNGDSG